MDRFWFAMRTARGFTVAMAASLLLPLAAHAQQSIGPLTSLDAFFNPLEQEAAFANQAIYNALTAPTDPNGGLIVAAPEVRLGDCATAGPVNANAATDAAAKINLRMYPPA